MGRTTPTVRQRMEEIAGKYGKMKALMRAGDVELFDRMLLMGRKHSPEVSMAGVDPEMGFIISVMLEIMKMQNTVTEKE